VDISGTLHTEFVPSEIGSATGDGGQRPTVGSFIILMGANWWPGCTADVYQNLFIVHCVSATYKTLLFKAPFTLRTAPTSTHARGRTAPHGTARRRRRQMLNYLLLTVVVRRQTATQRNMLHKSSSSACCLRHRTATQCVCKRCRRNQCARLQHYRTATYGAVRSVNGV